MNIRFATLDQRRDIGMEFGQTGKKISVLRGRSKKGVLALDRVRDQRYI